MKLRPRIFRYNGLGGTDADGKEYVGLLAQEVPRALAPYCRIRAEVLLRPTDKQPTEIYMLDHSAFPLLCMNALQQQERRLRALEMACAHDERRRTSEVTCLPLDFAKAFAQAAAPCWSFFGKG